MQDAFQPPSSGQGAALACILEATAPKPGNVHRGADFEDLTYPDLVISGLAIVPSMDAAVGRSLGQTVLSAVQATRRVVGTNSNLGMILLLAPLAAVPADKSVRLGVAEVLAGLNTEDSALVYQAIREAKPGGLSKVEEADVSGPPPDDLLKAMRLAAERDLVARQYVNDYEQVFELVLPRLKEGLSNGMSLGAAIVWAYLHLMSEYPDSLIARKCGEQVARHAALLAGRALSSGPPDSDAYHLALRDLDFWLRSDGHRRNPGTSADLVAAALYVAIREGTVRPPYRL